MWSYARAIALLTLCFGSLSACNWDGDYQVAVSWLINGTTPSADMCREHGIARARFEVKSASGERVKSIESDCADLITLSDGFDYGGFYTNLSFRWDVSYDYQLTLVDAAGNPVSVPVGSSFRIPWGDADVFELNYLDYVGPIGTSASLTAEWSFSNGTAVSVAQDCALQGVSKVRILATSALDNETLGDAVQIAEADCASGRFVSNGRILATGDYLFFLQAISPSNTVITTSDTQGVFVDFDQSVVLMCANFFATAR